MVDLLHTTAGLLHDRSGSNQTNLDLQVCENLRHTASKRGYFYVQLIPLKLWSNPKPCDVSIDCPSLVFRRLCVRELVQAFDNALIDSLHSSLIGSKVCNACYRVSSNCNRKTQLTSGFSGIAIFSLYAVT